MKALFQTFFVRVSIHVASIVLAAPGISTRPSVAMGSCCCDLPTVMLTHLPSPNKLTGSSYWRARERKVSWWLDY